MFVIVGATGRVGYATTSALRAAGAPVRAIVRDATKVGRLKDLGCDVRVADIQHVPALAEAMDGAAAVQVVAPLAPQAEDPVADLRQSMDSLAEALALARPRIMLAISDYGAHVSHDIGLPSVFRAFEHRLAELSGHKIMLRSAEHMHNWGRVVPVALASGTLPSFHDPVDAAFPTIAASDLGPIAAELLLRSPSPQEMEIVHAEGPRWYSAEDVANALSRLAHRPVQACAVPRSQWREQLERGSPATLVELLIKTNEAQNVGGLVEAAPGAGDIRRGSTELIDALRSALPADQASGLQR